MTEPVLTLADMRAAERSAMDAGVSEWELMRRAGEGAAAWVWRMAAGRPVTVLCGPGNNGGDGYVIADALHSRGGEVTVIAPVEPKSDTARLARANFEGRVSIALPPSANGVVVDCLFGYGLSRPLDEPYSTLLEESWASHSYRIAIDVPSGVDCDAGEWLGEPHEYDLTLALGAWKRAHFLMPACAASKSTRLVPIGLTFATGHDCVARRPAIVSPAPDSHKYRRGLVAVVAGEMAGAALLASRGAIHAGAGYVKLMSLHSHPDAPADLVIVEEALEKSLSDDRISAVVIGPGLGRDGCARERLAEVLQAGHPAIIDADALHLLTPDLLHGIDCRRLGVTPHEGELAALCKAFGVTNEGKAARAAGLRDATGFTVLAKGPDTVLAPANGGLRFFPRGSSWLSVAGSGDVLAGIAAARLALTGDLATAAEQAVWLHREAARIAAPAFSASDLAEAIRPAMAGSL